MTSRERDLSEDLRVLDEAHRLGCFSRDEYRERRRHMLALLLGGEGVTVRQGVCGARRAADQRRVRMAPAGRRTAAVSASLRIIAVAALVSLLLAWGWRIF